LAIGPLLDNVLNLTGQLQTILQAEKARPGQTDPDQTPGIDPDQPPLTPPDGAQPSPNNARALIFAAAILPLRRGAANAQTLNRRCSEHSCAGAFAWYACALIADA